MAKKKQRKATSPSRDSVVDRIQPVGDLETLMLLLLYGRSGTGKTHVAGTFPKPLLVIDVNERGTETIAKTPGIDVVRIQSWNEFHNTNDDGDDLYWFLRGETKYKSIVIDQLTNLQDFGMRHIRDQGNKGESELFSKRNWGQLSGLLKTAIQDYKELSDHYAQCWIAHERIFESDSEEEDEAITPSVGARVMPSVGSFLDGAVDAIGNTFIRERFVGKGKEKVRKVEYCMRTGPHAHYSTKIRRPATSGPLPEAIVNPTYQKIVDLTAGKEIVRKKKVTKRRTK